MPGLTSVFLGCPSLIEFSGPDALRFLNGQVTQDVRRVSQDSCALPACVTDAKGKLQFRVMLSLTANGHFWVSCQSVESDRLLDRLTRYLIADDVEVRDLTGSLQLIHHLTDKLEHHAHRSLRFGKIGYDQWLAANEPVQEMPSESSQAWQAWRIQNGIPQWGNELYEGILPPEAGLDLSDISYAKGCYIGQEVISRIKSAGKVNQRLTHWLIPGNVKAANMNLLDEEGKDAGRVTSISPVLEADGRYALGYLKRSANTAHIQDVVSGQWVEIHPI